MATTTVSNVEATVEHLFTCSRSVTALTRSLNELQLLASLRVGKLKDAQSELGVTAQYICWSKCGVHDALHRSIKTTSDLQSTAKLALSHLQEVFVRLAALVLS